MEQIKMIMVKTLDNCISWTPKHADYFLGEAFFKTPNFYFIFGKKSLESVPFIKYLHDTAPYKCLVLSRNFTFPKLIANIRLHSDDAIADAPVYYVLGGKRVFELFDRLASEIISVNIQINSINHPDSVFYRFPQENFEITKVARKNFDLYKQKINYDVTTYRNQMSSFSGWTSQENAYLELGQKVVSCAADVLFAQKVSFDLQRENFPILTTREIYIENFVPEATKLYQLYINRFQSDLSHQQIVRNGQHFIQIHQSKEYVDHDVAEPVTFVSVLVYIPETFFFEQLPHDISMYSLFLILICQTIKRRQPKHLHLVIGNLKSSEEDIQLISSQVKRCPLPFPSLKICVGEDKDNQSKISVELENYYHWPAI